VTAVLPERVIDGIGTGAAIEAVGHVAGIEGIVAGTADEVGDIVELVAHRIEPLAARVLVRSTVTPPVVVAHRIDTAATGKDVGLGAGLEEVVGGAADDVVDVDQDIALGIAANAGAVLEVDGHAGGQAA
jgi:hypothetical protein